jgi:hypothetical protein
MAPDDLRDLLDPAPAFTVFELHQLLVGPMKVIGDEGYLLVEPVEGVA